VAIWDDWHDTVYFFLVYGVFSFLLLWVFMGIAWLLYLGWDYNFYGAFNGFAS